MRYKEKSFIFYDNLSTLKIIKKLHKYYLIVYMKNESDIKLLISSIVVILNSDLIAITEKENTVLFEFNY